jgi:hypothetical protein
MVAAIGRQSTHRRRSLCMRNDIDKEKRDEQLQLKSTKISNQVESSLVHVALLSALLTFRNEKPRTILNSTLLCLRSCLTSCIFKLKNGPLWSSRRLGIRDLGIYIELRSYEVMRSSPLDFWDFTELRENGDAGLKRLGCGCQVRLLLSWCQTSGIYGKRAEQVTRKTTPRLACVSELRSLSSAGSRSGYGCGCARQCNFVSYQKSYIWYNRIELSRGARNTSPGCIWYFGSKYIKVCNAQNDTGNEW